LNQRRKGVGHFQEVRGEALDAFGEEAGGITCGVCVGFQDTAQCTQRSHQIRRKGIGPLRGELATNRDRFLGGREGVFGTMGSDSFDFLLLPIDLRFSIPARGLRRIWRSFTAAAGVMARADERQKPMDLPGHDLADVAAGY